MSQYNRPPSGHDCPPTTKHPADQPKAPGGDPCGKLPDPDPPKLPDLTPCDPPPSDCRCPGKPVSSPKCLELLIAEQAAEIATAEKAKAFKTDLEALLAKAKAAEQEYTKDKYDALVKLWVERDAKIAAFIRGFVCTVPCWRCIIDCHVCPLLNEMRDAEQRLYGDGTLPSEAKNLYDMQHWRARDKDQKERTFSRIKAVLAAWEKPAQTIEKALSDIKAAMDVVEKAGPADAGKVVYDLFLKIVPLHLAIAPPKESGFVTKIEMEYTNFCACDIGTPDDCCGPDVGGLTLRERLIGPQAYLVEPNDYIDIICCLVKERYGPAKQAFALAEAAAAGVDTEIKNYKAQVENGLKSFEKDAKRGIPSAIDCCDYEPKKSESETTEAR
jgi:hypothetical protein